MPTNYKVIAEENRRYYGEGDRHLNFLKHLYTNKTHFIYELIQNADDAGSKNLFLALCKDGLLVHNDGRKFNENDVRNICSIGSSKKDLTQIGTFGIGFKSVYTYTNTPSIYSGEEAFRLRRPVEPEAIEEIPPEIKRLIDEGKTVFYLPFKKELRHRDIEQLKDQLRNLHPWTLLFLRHLETIQWRNEYDGEESVYRCSRCRYDKIANSWIVKLSVNGKQMETFLVFRKEVQPPLYIIEELLSQAEDDEERERIQRSSGSNQIIEVAFRLHDNQIIPLDHCVLFAYLPTEKETHLRFLIQARYQTTPARDNVPTDSPWNKWLVQETAQFLSDVLMQLKAAGLLTPSFFDVLPLSDDGVPELLQPIVESLAKALREGEFIPTQSGAYARPDQVFYPHAESLRVLLTDQDLVELTGVEGASWLHSDIRNIEEHRRRFKVVRAAGVREVGASQLVTWLMKKGAEWLSSKEDAWLRSLYIYLKHQKSELERIRNLPLVRLESGEQVCAAEQLVFFPPDTEQEYDELEPLLLKLPILRSTLLEGEEASDVKSFLETLGVKPLKPEELIRNWILPQYQSPNNCSVEENRVHLRYIFKTLDKVPSGEKPKLLQEIRQTPLLWAYKGVQGQEYKFVKPIEAYLPQAYTGYADLEIYFASCLEVWFVDKDYIQASDETGKWRNFLKQLGCADLPRVVKKQVSRRDIGFEKFRQECEKRGIVPEYGTRDESIEDRYIDGLSEALNEVINSNNKALARVIWQMLLKILPPNESLLRGTYRWFYYSQRSKEFDATFYRQIKEIAWLPDDHEEFYRPTELFAPTPENRKLLGDTVTYLHPDFDLNDNQNAKWLAQKLGIHLTANSESVLNYLRSLSGKEVNIEIVKELYNFLNQRGVQRRQEFLQKALIFTPTPQPRWWHAGQVFWEDESAVFGEHRGYLKLHYPETLKPFFISVGVPERAAPLDYIRAIRDIASSGQVTDADEILNRLKTLYRRLWHALQEGGDWQQHEEWDHLLKGKYWLGRKVEWNSEQKCEQLGLYTLTQLVWNDHPYIADLFQQLVPFWVFDDLTELAKYLKVKPCSEAEVNFQLEGETRSLDDWSERMQKLVNDIQCFLESPQWSDRRCKEASLSILPSLRVCSVEGMCIIYSLNGVSVKDPKPRPSYLDAKSGIIYLASGADKQDYSELIELIGDALQDYFGVRELREFVKDLLTGEREKVLERWRRRGLEMKQIKRLEEQEETIKPLPIPTTGETIPRSAPSGVSEMHARQPTKEVAAITSPEIQEEHNDRGSQPVGRSSGGGYSGRGGASESEEHKQLKEMLAANPSLLGESLKCIEIEHEFPSGDRVDILLEDSDDMPVVVEVEAKINPGEYTGVWQALKYKHLIAIEKGLPCDRPRSILVAPIIPDDVKKKCKELGVEPKEVSF